MSIVAQYEKQHRWRRWDQALSHLSIKKGDRVLDLGSATGHLTDRLHQLGADVIGLEMNLDLLRAARTRFPELRFEPCDLSTLEDAPGGLASGLWAGFIAAYFPNLEETLKRWRGYLADGGWIALTEIDDLLGHDPLPMPWHNRMRRFYDDARNKGRYDFESGRRLSAALSQSGFQVVHEGLLEDDELCFQGPASADVFTAWQERLGRMQGLRRYLGDDVADFQRAFLGALASPSHTSRTRVFYVVAQRR